MMTTDQVGAALLARYGVRADPATRAYVARLLLTAGGPFPIVAGDARTGLPVRQVVVPAEMASAAGTTPDGP